jgi:hypothetical protein
MAISPRPCSWLFRPFVLVIPILSLGSEAGADQTRSVRLTSVANATLRSAPSADAEAIAQLPLGTSVQDAGPAGLDKTWVLVRLSDTQEGWLQSRLTKVIDPAWRTETYDAIIADRLARKGDGFAATVELLSFIERVAPEYGDPASRADLELARLRALARAAAAVPFNATRDPYQSWLKVRQQELVYDEPGGRWIVRNPVIWTIHARHADTPASDEIAWFAVTTGLAGECEGHVACYVAAQNALHGAYLRAHPFGRHAVDAVGLVNSTLDAVWSGGQFTKPYSFDPKADCRELVAAVDGLASAIQTSRAAGWESAVANLGRVREQCP